MKLFLLFMISLGACTMTTPAQTKSYDIASYAAPKNWKEEKNDGYIAYSKTDGGSWAQIAIYKSTASKGSIEEDAQTEWDAIVLVLHAVENEEQNKAENKGGWMVMSRSGVWQYNGTNVATMLTTYSNGTTSISILCNATAKPYLQDYQKMIASVKLTATTKKQPATKTTANNASVTGLWTYNFNETSGYSNGMPLTSGGYFKKEYLFKADGTYQYRAKNWSVFVKDILFVNETGTYTVNGNQLTITPVKGSGQWWAKAASGRTEGWGRYQKASDHPLEKITYTYEIKYLSGMEQNYLILKANKSTARDGSQSAQNKALHEFNYSRQDNGKSLIDNPPGGQ